MKTRKKPTHNQRGSHGLVVVCLLVGIVVLGLVAVWCGLSLSSRHGPTVSDTASTVFSGASTDTVSQPLTSSATARLFSRFVIMSAGERVGTAVVVSLPNPGATTLIGRLLRAPEDLSLCIVLDSSGVVHTADVLGRGNTVPGVSATRRSATAWAGHSVFQLSQGETAGVPQGGESTSDVMIDLGRTIVRADYGDAVLARCEAAPTGDPIALRDGDFVPALEVVSVAGQRVNLAAILGHPSLLMNCDPSCGTCFNMTVDLFTRVSQSGTVPETMVVLMEASADSERGKLLLASLPKGVTVVEDPDNAVAKHIGMNVSAFGVVSDGNGRVTWSRLIAVKGTVGEAVYRVEQAILGGS